MKVSCTLHTVHTFQDNQAFPSRGILTPTSFTYQQLIPCRCSRVHLEFASPGLLLGVQSCSQRVQNRVAICDCFSKPLGTSRVGTTTAEPKDQEVVSWPAVGPTASQASCDMKLVVLGALVAVSFMMAYQGQAVSSESLAWRHCRCMQAAGRRAAVHISLHSPDHFC